MDLLNLTLNATEDIINDKNETKPIVNDPYGLVASYFSLFMMAIVPIYIGAHKSLAKLIKQKKDKDPNVEFLSNNDAAMFPLCASGALFILYLIFKIFSKQYIDLLLGLYIFFLGVYSLSNALNPLVDEYIPDFFANHIYHISIAKEMKTSVNLKEPTGDTKSEKKSIFQYSFKKKHFISLGVATVVGVWYLLTKNWIANNLFGLSFSIQAIETIFLNKVITGCILLGGLFIYDIFWVFGTNVMVTVAKSFEAPIKVVFPRDLFVTGFASTNFSMLGLGDIIIPGIFVALLLRFDDSQRKGSRRYFMAGYVAYILGFIVTMIVLHVSKHAQPALLYLCPACLGVPVVMSLVLGDFARLFTYVDNPELEDKKNK